MRKLIRIKNVLAIIKNLLNMGGLIDYSEINTESSKCIVECFLE